MDESNPFSVFGLRAGGPWIIVLGAKEVHDSDVCSHWEYSLHWTGQSWEERSGSGAFVFDYRKYADEEIRENRQAMIAKIPRNIDLG